MWLTGETKLMGIAQMRSDGLWENKLLPEPIKIADGSIIEAYSNGGLTVFKDNFDFLASHGWFVEIGGLSLKEEDIVAKWKIKLK